MSPEKFGKLKAKKLHEFYDVKLVETNDIQNYTLEK